MYTKTNTGALRTVAALLVALPVFADPSGAVKRPAGAEKIAGLDRKVLWVDPVNIADRNLLYGQGGAEHQPKNVGFDFQKEDLEATNPKFNVRDADGQKWKVKLGAEARPETVATRLVWAVGFHTDEDYFLPAIQVRNLPRHVRRGQELIDADGTMHNARLERDIPGEKKIGVWKWSNGPFTGTREWNALRVMMALVNNWDLKDVNNSVYQMTGSKNREQGGEGELLYVVSDLGATFGPTQLDLSRGHGKGELSRYHSSRFIRKAGSDQVGFAAPGAPSLLYIFNPFIYIPRVRLMWIGHGIPIQDARWIGSVLARLSAGQIRDAFRAGGYSPVEIEAFATIVEQRITALNHL